MSESGGTPGAAGRAARRRRIPGGRATLNFALVVAAVAGFAILVTRDAPDPGVEIVRDTPPAGVDEIVVHVSGAVAEPGLVTLEPGDRVDDAVQRAGGATADADLGAVNLARRMHDEDHVHVPVAGESSPLIDINTASQEELESLPGIGPVRGEAIIEARGEAPFATTDDLAERGVIPASVYEDIRDLVTASDATAGTP